MTGTRKSKNEEQEDEAAIMERMDRALKKALSTPPETHEEMVKRRRGEQKAGRGRARARKLQE